MLPRALGDEHGEAPNREELDERHGKPGEIRALLALGAAVHVVHQGPWAPETEDAGRAVQARGHARAVERYEGGVFTRRQCVFRHAEDPLAGVRDGLPVRRPRT